MFILNDVICGVLSDGSAHFYMGISLGLNLLFKYLVVTQKKIGLDDRMDLLLSELFYIGTYKIRISCW